MYKHSRLPPCLYNFRKEIETLMGCFECGYSSAFLVCADPAKLAQAEEEVSAALGEHHVQCILPAQISSFLKNLARTEERTSKETIKPDRIANHDVSRASPKLTAAERRKREHAMLKLIAEAISAKSTQDGEI